MCGDWLPHTLRGCRNGQTGRNSKTPVCSFVYVAATQSSRAVVLRWSCLGKAFCACLPYLPLGKHPDRLHEGFWIVHVSICVHAPESGCLCVRGELAIEIMRPKQEHQRTSQRNWKFMEKCNEIWIEIKLQLKPKNEINYQNKCIR